jgi:quercetin dioxygenase-like cupin family protein
MFEALRNFRNKDKTLITFTQLEDLPLNQVMQLYPNKPGSVETIKITSSEKDLSFRVDMKKGEVWESHMHDCLETILVYKGKLLEHITKKEINRLNPIIIKSYTEHIVEALEDCIFYVEFKNPHIL